MLRCTCRIRIVSRQKVVYHPDSQNTFLLLVIPTSSINVMVEYHYIWLMSKIEEY
jgi:hypothetical protein